MKKTTPYTPFGWAALIWTALTLSGAAAVTNVWTGSESDDWFTGENWSLSAIPAADEHVVVNETAVQPLLLTNETPLLASFTLTNSTMYVSNWTARVQADLVTLASNALLTIPRAFSNNWMSNRVWLSCRELRIESNAVINLDGKGFFGGSYRAVGHGPGGGIYFSTGCLGGSHGARGGHSGIMSAGKARYGDPVYPETAGSGGGGQNGAPYGGGGGGAARFEVLETATIHGLVTANGLNGGAQSGGGAGGSILILCRELRGTGILSARGGSTVIQQYSGGIGGGGRIAVHYDPDFQTNRPAIRFQTASGAGYRDPDLLDGTLDLGSLYLTDGRFLTPDLIDPLFESTRLHIPGLTNLAWNYLSWSNNLVGLPGNGFEVTIAGALRLATNSGLYLEDNVSLACGALALHGDSALSLGTNAALQIGALTESHGRFSMPATEWGMAALTLTAGYFRVYASNSTIRIDGDLALSNAARLGVVSGVTNGLNTEPGARVMVTGELAVRDTARIISTAHRFKGGAVQWQAQRLAVGPSAAFDADGQGYQGGYWRDHGFGPGRGFARTAGGSGGGAGHGGQGGHSGGAAPVGAGGVTNGNPAAPLFAGSGGGAGNNGAGRGGGAIRLDIAGLADIQGTLTANGGHGATQGGGGGAGGSILLAAGSIAAGPGALLSVRGGNGHTSGSNFGAGGGGGRLALWSALPAGVRQLLLAGGESPASLRVDALPGVQTAVNLAPGSGYVDPDPDRQAKPGTATYLRAASGTLLIIR